MASSAVEVFCLHMKQYANKSFHRSEKIKIIFIFALILQKYKYAFCYVHTTFVSSKLKVELGGPRGRAAKSAVS